MIPFVRSHAELMAMTQSRDQDTKNSTIETFNRLTEDSAQRKRYIRSQKRPSIDLPKLPKKTRHKWRMSKTFISSVFDNLDHNDNYQSTFDITILERQSDYDCHDVA